MYHTLEVSLKVMAGANDSDDDDHNNALLIPNGDDGG